MLDIITYGNFKPLGKQKKKHQIILTNTSRNIEDYLCGLKHRFDGVYPKIPNYIVTKEGKILKLLSNVEHSNYFTNPNLNRNSIIVSLENLGWLQKEPLNDRYVNWIGDIYKGNVFERKWRDYFFWHPYTTTQVEKTGELCKEILKDMSIPKQSVEHNTKIIGIEKYNGVVARSNFNEKYTDVNPSFNFDLLLKTIYNE